MAPIRCAVQRRRSFTKPQATFGPSRYFLAIARSRTQFVTLAWMSTTLCRCQRQPKALKAIGMMLRAFPSSQSTITAETPKVYGFAVEEFSLEAIRRACRAFVRGEVEGHNADFAPSTAKLAQVVKGF